MSTKVFNKLVRDRIPDIISEKGKSCETKTVEGSELISALATKLIEEKDEFQEEPSVEELADILEVVHGLIHHHGTTLEEVEIQRQKKRELRGGFDNGVFLISVSE